MTSGLCILLGIWSHHSLMALNLPPLSLRGWYVFLTRSAPTRITAQQQQFSLYFCLLLSTFSLLLFILRDNKTGRKKRHYCSASSKTSFMGWPCSLALLTPRIWEDPSEIIHAVLSLLFWLVTWEKHQRSCLYPFVARKMIGSKQVQGWETPSQAKRETSVTEWG